MDAIRLPAQALVVVADGRKALFLRNRGTALKPRLETEDVLEQDNPPTREQGTDRPGRRRDASASHISAMEETDWHAVGEARFAATIADTLNRRALDERFSDLVVVASPQTLGALRSALSERVREQLIAEIPKTLTGHEVPEIQTLLTGSR